MRTFCKMVIEQIKNFKFSDTFEMSEDESLSVEDNPLMDDSFSLDEYAINQFPDEEITENDSIE